jgi:hypothetical protein
MLNTIEVGMRVMHPDLRVGRIQEVGTDKMVVAFALHTVQFCKNEPNLSLIEKGKASISSGGFHLGSKMEAVVDVMNDGLFRTLPEISELTGYQSLTGLSAGIRSLRKPENGNRTVDKRKRDDSNEFEYRLVRGL